MRCNIGHKIVFLCITYCLLSGYVVFARDSVCRKRPLTILFTSDLHSSIDPDRSLCGGGDCCGSNGCSCNCGSGIVDKSASSGCDCSCSGGCPHHGGGCIVGGVARLKTLIDRERELAESRGDAVLLVDAGDIAMGSVYNILFSSSASEYVALMKLGYDAFTFGNHDFDYGLASLAEMIQTASATVTCSTTSSKDTVTCGTTSSNAMSCNKTAFSTTACRITTNNALTRNTSSCNTTSYDTVTCSTTSSNATYCNKTACNKTFNAILKQTILLNANLKFNDQNLNRALRLVNSVSDTIITRDGVKIGLIGAVGREAYAAITNKDRIVFLDRDSAVNSCVRRLKSNGADYIVLLSHAGSFHKNSANRSPDALLAKNVEGIDVIISGHDHIPMFESLNIGNTIIANAGCNSEYLGMLRIDNNLSNNRLSHYKLIPVTSDINPSEDLQIWTDSLRMAVADSFRDRFSIDIFDTISILDSSYSAVPTGIDNFPLGNLVADSYRDYVIGNLAVDSYDNLIALVPCGTIRRGLGSGSVTYADIYECLSVGSESRKYLGNPLVLGYLYGREIKDIVEINPSLGNLLPDARLYFSGLSYSYNSYRLPLTRVKDIYVCGNKLQNNELYPVVTNLYAAQLIGLMKQESFGLLDAVIKDRDGVAVKDLNDIFLTDTLGYPVYEWIVMSDYLLKRGRNSAESNVDVSAENSVMDDIEKRAFEVYAKDESSKITLLLYLLCVAGVTVAIYCLFRYFRRRF